MVMVAWSGIEERYYTSTYTHSGSAPFQLKEGFLFFTSANITSNTLYGNIMFRFPGIKVHICKSSKCYACVLIRYNIHVISQENLYENIWLFKYSYNVLIGVPISNT